MFKRIFTLSVLALALPLLPGCASSPQVEESIQVVWGEQWNFDSYRVTEGQGQVFSGAGKTYAILPGGLAAKQLLATGDPRWVQQGAVIHIDGQPEKLHVQADGGVALKAERVATSLPAPAAGPSPTVTTAPLDATPAAHNPRIVRK